MYCETCKKHIEEGRFCPDCGSRLVEDPKPNPQDTLGSIGLNLGDANAISGGLSVSTSHSTDQSHTDNSMHTDNSVHTDSSVHNVSNVSNVTHNVTQVAAAKTEYELLAEKKQTYQEACMRAYADRVLDTNEMVELELLRLKLGLDKKIADHILCEVKKIFDVQAKQKELTGVAKIKFAHFKKAISCNNKNQLGILLNDMLPLLDKYDVDELYYSYYIVLASLDAKRCIAQFKANPTDSYWQMWCTCVAYAIEGDTTEQTALMIAIDDKFPNYPSDNIAVLAAVCAYIQKNKELATEYINTVCDNCSPSLINLSGVMFKVLRPDLIEYMDYDEQVCPFYMQTLLHDVPESKCDTTHETDVDSSIPLVEKNASIPPIEERTPIPLAEDNPSIPSIEEKPSNPPVAEKAIEKESLYDVYLTKAGAKKLVVMQYLVKTLGLPMNEAQQSIKGSIIKLASQCELADANKLKSELEEIGAMVRVDKVEGQVNIQESPSNPPVAEKTIEKESLYDVYLTKAGAKKLVVMQYLVKTLGLPMNEAQQSIKGSIIKLASQCELADANKLKSELEEIGAMVRVDKVED